MNRGYGLIAGATGTGQTVTLQSLAETFSQMGTAVLRHRYEGNSLWDCQAGGHKESVTNRVAQYGLEGGGGGGGGGERGYRYAGCPVRVFGIVFGIKGNPLRLSVSSLGPFCWSAY